MAAGADLFDLFWENSTLNARTGPAFSRRIEDHSRAVAPSAAALQYPGGDVPLRRPRDPLARTMFARRSERGFSPRPVTLRQLGSLFAAFASSRRGARTYASAGGTYPLEVYCLVDRCADGLASSVVYYNNDSHSLACCVNGGGRRGIDGQSKDGKRVITGTDGGRGPACAAIRASEYPLAGDGGEYLLRGIWVEKHRGYRPEG